MNKVKNTTSERLVRILIIFLTSFVLCNSLSSQTTLKGTIDPSLKVDSFTFAYTTNFVENNNIFSRGNERIIQVKNGQFKIYLEESPEVFYAKFNFPKNYSDTIGNDYKVLGNNANLFMIKPNTTVQIDVLPQKVIFSGEQKYLMECQMELGTLYYHMAKERIILSNSKGVFDDNTSKDYVWQYLAANRALYDSAMSDAKVVVSNYTMHLDAETRNVIYYNFFGKMRYGEINQLNFIASFNKDTLRSYVLEYYNMFYSADKCPDEAEGYLGKSNMYPNYLAYKTRTDIAMRLGLLSRTLRPDLLMVDRLIAERYSGNLYDQVTFSSLLGRGKEYMEDMYFETLLGSVKNEEYLAHIREVRDKRSGGQKAYQFELEDENGKVYTNADFKGKVVLLDFWFSGCRGCIALHKNMQPVKEYFKDNSNFVYVSISTDNDKALWKKSLAGGLYTDETDVKLWVGDLKGKHPIVKNYDIDSYPTIIIIDGNDEVVAMNPPNPYTEHNKNALISIIEGAINQ